MCICIRQYHQISGLHLWAVFRRRNVVMGIDFRWVSRGRRDVVSYHKWMTSHNFFDFGVTCTTFISLCPNIRNTGLYFYLAFFFSFFFFFFFFFHHNIVYSKSPVYNNLNVPGVNIKGPCFT